MKIAAARPHRVLHIDDHVGNAVGHFVGRKPALLGGDQNQRQTYAQCGANEHAPTEHVNGLYPCKDELVHGDTKEDIIHCPEPFLVAHQLDR